MNQSGQIGSRTFYAPEKAREYINFVLDTGRLSYGRFSRDLEKAFAKLHGCNYGVLANSGTSALQVAVQALKELQGWRDGDEVLVPAVTFVATANVVLHNRLVPVPVDVEPDYYCIDPNRLGEFFNSKTRAIIPVHLFGLPCSREVFEHGGPGGLSIIEDSCEAVLVKNGDDPVGSQGDVGCFSFYMAHHINCGVGGMSITNDGELARRMRSLVNHGLVIPGDVHETGFSPDIMARDFRFDSVGHSFRVTELEAALGLAQLEEIATIVYKRTARAEYLTDGLGQFSDRLQLPGVRPLCHHSWMVYPMVVRGDYAHNLRRRLAEAGIGSRDAMPLVTQRCYENLGWQLVKYPVALSLLNSGFYISIHQNLDLAQLDRVIEVVSRWYKEQS